MPKETSSAKSSAGGESRRAVLGRAAMALVGLTAAVGCKKKPLVCEGLPGLTADELQLRKLLLYAEAAPTADKACLNCTLYVPPREPDSCGACKVLHGSIHPNGTCKIFMRKPEGGAPT